MVEELNEFTGMQRAVLDVKNTMNLYTDEALNWLLEIGHTVKFREGKSMKFGKGDFNVMTFHAEGFKPKNALIQTLLDKHPELVVPYYNAEMMNQHIELLVAPAQLKARHEEYVLKLEEAINILTSK